MYQNSSLE